MKILDNECRKCDYYCCIKENCSLKECAIKLKCPYVAEEICNEIREEK